MSNRITLETPVLSDNSGNVVNVYIAVISAMSNNATTILQELNASNGKQENLVEIINALHTLVANCQQYSLHGCVIYAMKKNNIQVIEQVMRHPILKIILLYLYGGGPSSGLYLDWVLNVYVSGFFRKNYNYQLDYRLVNFNPSVEAPSIKMYRKGEIFDNANRIR